MYDGWIRIHRKILNNIIFQNDKAFKIWIWCLLKANHQDNECLIGRQKITLKRGQFVFGSNKAKGDLGMSKSTIHYWLCFLISERYIERKTNSKYSIITILNYNKYQTDERKTGNKWNARRTQSEPITETNKNVKNDKNEKNINISKDILRKLTNEYINSNNRKDIRIILLFARAKGKYEWTKLEENSFIKRNLRAAKLLEPYSYERIMEVLKWLKDNADFKWTLETVGKYIDENLSVLNKNKEDEQVQIPEYARKWQK